jgi:hypothetical protein
MGVCCSKVPTYYFDIKVHKEPNEFQPLKTKEKFQKIKTVNNKTPNLSLLLPELFKKKKIMMKIIIHLKEKLQNIY